MKVDMNQVDINNLHRLKPVIIKGEHPTRKVWLGKDKNSLKELTPYEGFRLIVHSPDGFNWGYSGSGPAQLALSIIILYVQDKEWIFKLYQAFKFEVIASFPKGQSFEKTIDIGKWFKKNI
jgi:hypothetical protein